MLRPSAGWAAAGCGLEDPLRIPGPQGFPNERATTPRTFCALLYYMYSGFLPGGSGALPAWEGLEVGVEELLGVLCLAHMYRIPHLTQTAERHVVVHRLVTAESVAHIREWAETYGADQLQRYCQKYLEEQAARVAEGGAGPAIASGPEG
eukprot:tig00000025_g7927.t1